MLPLIAVPMGDPAGIGPEILVKALSEYNFTDICRILVIGSKSVLSQALSTCKTHLPIINTDTLETVSNRKQINLHACAEYAVETRVGNVSALGGQAAYDCIENSVKLALTKRVDAIATTPINKLSLKAAGINHIGHTEILAALSGSASPLTLFQVHNLRVFFLSRHLSLRKACDFVTADNVYGCATRIYEAMSSLGLRDPHLAIAALNPHGGEQALFGDEEDREVLPAISKLKAEGYKVTGPVPADAVFHQALNGKFDAVLSLYHDQGHIATKMVDFERTVSITCGLPFLRTSVDHGTAFDIAGTGKASAVSMIEAILTAAKYAASFQQKK
ncbi:4-hydroxythreonine-4-phosphate dehydrogenase PdxA [Endozoicomonas sp. OPT23]|uniref:4-hydroxythreonine-4-phosphate dehydrogenase PdxA n=1 Tax=Endozoicomonas sp. OPT23 TaxID=2072845 RepID=UPI001E44212D|nr:4-hydroxythreonine-4-phosphate dehydrogenase PdxA [Endozoicomonas sp. OPT23]